MRIPILISSTRKPLKGKTSKLKFTMQLQAQTEWCWSAVATSVSLFYNAGSAWTQCKLANAQLSQTTCCNKGSTSQCNQPWYLDSALTQVGNLARYASGATGFNATGKEITASRPLGVRIGWSGGGGHFIVVDGYSTVGGQFVHVDDPWYGPSNLTYSHLVSAYQGTGSWTDSYFTS